MSPTTCQILLNWGSGARKFITVPGVGAFSNGDCGGLAPEEGTVIVEGSA